MLLQRGLAGCAASALLFLTACQSKQGGADVVASVDGRKIFRNDVEKYYLNQTSGADQQQAVPVGEQATSLRLSILRELIDDEILMHRAEKLGLLATDEEVDRKMNEIKSPYTQQQFDQKLKDKKITLDDFRRDLRRSLTVEKVLNTLAERFETTRRALNDISDRLFSIGDANYSLETLFNPKPEQL